MVIHNLRKNVCKLYMINLSLQNALHTYES